MDEKQSLLGAEDDRRISSDRATSRVPRHLKLTAVLMIFMLLWTSSRLWLLSQVPYYHHDDSKVKLEAHIMSKCPDAKDCLKDLIVPAMANISDKVDFTLSYIGEINDDDSSVECKHGPSECLGNIIELCAANLYPDPKIHLGFTMCLTEDYQDIPEKDLVKGCALEYGIDFDELNECASKDDGTYGLDLLRQSVQRTKDADVVYSCTVRLNDEVRCIRDGGEWKDCLGGSDPEDLIRDIEEASRETWYYRK